MGVLNGQVALVTGGGRGIGRGVALALAAEGASVAIDDVFVDEWGVSAAVQTATDIERTGAAGLALREDVSTSAGARAMVEAVVARFGRLDILVTCAGNVTRGLLHELSEEQWDSVINLHLRGHFLSCKMALPHMLERNSGRIITVASRGAFFPVAEHKGLPRGPRRPSSSAYSAAKAGIMGMSTTLALELWETGITVNCLLPSAATQLFPETRPRSVGGTPPTQSLDPSDVAPSVVFLCSPAGANISGRFFYAAGGDIVFFGQPLEMQGSRMVRKGGRWTQAELAELLPPLLGVPGP